MSQTSYALLSEHEQEVPTMRALVFHGPNQIRLEKMLIPRAQVGEAVMMDTCPVRSKAVQNGLTRATKAAIDRVGHRLCCESKNAASNPRPKVGKCLFM